MTPAQPVVKNFTYDSLGNLRQEDADCCQQQRWNYSAVTQYAYPDSVIRGPAGTQLTTGATYNFPTGLVATTTDENGKVTTFDYDTLKRLTFVQRPDNAQISYTYDDTARTITVKTPVQGTDLRVQTTSYDGLGRPVKTTAADASLASYSIVETQYDPRSRAYKVSNPHNSTAQYWTETRFDALGRPLKVIPPDGTATANNVTYAYSVLYNTDAVTVTDPAGKQRMVQYDPVGRVFQVWEPRESNPSQLTQWTSYGYTVFDTVGGVSQLVEGLPPAWGTQRRTYDYDALGRLISVKTPETRQAGPSGQDRPIVYEYNDFNLLTRRKDARGVDTYYRYDALNRLIGLSYVIPVGSDVAPMPNVCNPVAGQPPNANVCFFYDEGGAAANALGRLTRVVDATGSETYSYDLLGQRTQVQKVISGTTYTLRYDYNLAGELNTLTHPSGRVVTQTYDAIGRLDKISSGTTDYASLFTYNPAGQVTGFNYGNGVGAVFGYTAARSQLSSITYSIRGTVDLFKLNYGYLQGSGNNGQITSISDAVEPGRTLTLTYDAWARLKTAATSGSPTFPRWGLEWAYDRFGNRTEQRVTAGSPPSNSVTVDPLTNRITDPGYSYDAAGNMTSDGLNTLVYDGESRVASNTQVGMTTNYTYDGNGLRVRKCAPNCTSPTSTTVYIFSGTKVIAEYDNGAAPASPTREYVYSGAGLLATLEGGATKYHHADHLSVRVSTDSAGNPARTFGHHPFGEDWYQTGAADKWKFTSYERDGESANDYAMFRYYLNRLGRFNSPDPIAGSISDPQSLNRYTYVRNDPINLIDPLGLSQFCFGYDVWQIRFLVYPDGRREVVSEEYIGFIAVMCFPDARGRGDPGGDADAPQPRPPQPQSQAPAGPPMQELKHWATWYFCGSSPEGAVLNWMESGAVKGAIGGALAGFAGGALAGGLGGIPGAILGGFTGGVVGASAGALWGSAAAGVCYASGVYH